MVDRPSFSVPEDCDPRHIRVLAGEMNRYVSRAGLKLESALDRLSINLQGCRVLDIGISTGGFADCVLHRGAESVVGVDVGRGQLHESLLKDSRVTLYEGINARSLSQSSFAQEQGLESFDVVVIDVSFISLSVILKEVLLWLRPGGIVVSLVKPQFEVGRKFLNKQGLVKKDYDYTELESEVKQWFSQEQISVKNYIESPLQGGDGNREFLLHGEKLVGNKGGCVGSI